MVESIQLTTMATLYNMHFVSYNMGKKQATQRIPTIVWNQIYVNY